jgi:spore coat polysaccharide biosynthesis protein SpsF (cytidylyltransferase family)
MVNNPYIIIQARMNSERLPGKVMKSIKGIPLIGILIQRISKSGIPIVVATSTNKENDELVDYVKAYNVNVYRGSEANVLERYLKAAKDVQASIIIRVTGDNPLLDGFFLKEQFSYFSTFKGTKNYLSTGLSNSFPLGMSAEIFSLSLLEEAFQNAKSAGEFEHVTPYMHQNIPGNINIITPVRKISKYHYRLTIDTEEDFTFHKKLMEEYGCDKLNMEEIISVVDAHPELIQINRYSIQKKWND